MGPHLMERCLLKGKFFAFLIIEHPWTTCFGLWVYGQFEYKFQLTEA